MLEKRLGRRNLSAEKNLKIHYDLDGCYSLLIAIILNVGASKAWTLYERGRNQKNDFDISQLRNSDGMKSEQQAFIVLKEKGYSNEVIEYSGRFYTPIPEIGNHRSDMKETAIPF